MPVALERVVSSYSLRCIGLSLYPATDSVRVASDEVSEWSRDCLVMALERVVSFSSLRCKRLCLYPATDSVTVASDEVSE